MQRETILQSQRSRYGLMAIVRPSLSSIPLWGIILLVRLTRVSSLNLTDTPLRYVSLTLALGLHL